MRLCGVVLPPPLVLLGVAPLTPAPPPLGVFGMIVIDIVIILIISIITITITLTIIITIKTSSLPSSLSSSSSSSSSPSSSSSSSSSFLGQLSQEPDLPQTILVTIACLVLSCRRRNWKAFAITWIGCVWDDIPVIVDALVKRAQPQGIALLGPGRARGGGAVNPRTGIIYIWTP